MLNLTEEDAFWEFVATHNTYVQHQANGNKIKGEYRFSRYNDEGTIGDLSKLGSPRLELLDSPGGAFNDNGGGFQWDAMNRTLRIIAKFKNNDFADKLIIQQNCKAACAEIARYILQEQNGGELCRSLVIKMIDTKTIVYELIDIAGDGSFTGCQMRLQFRTRMSAAPVNYGTFIYP